MAGRIILSGVAAAFIVASVPQTALSLPVAPVKSGQFGDAGEVKQLTAQENVKRKTTTTKRVTTTTPRRATTQTNKNVRVNRNVQVDRNVRVNRNVQVNRNVRVNRTVIVRRPYRAWVYRPYYGTIIGGIALGTVIGVSAAYAVPVAPAPNLCWYWADPAGWRGYWDYCVY